MFVNLAFYGCGTSDDEVGFWISRYKPISDRDTLTTPTNQFQLTDVSEWFNEDSIFEIVEHGKTKFVFKWCPQKNSVPIEAGN